MIARLRRLTGASSINTVAVGHRRRFVCASTLQQQQQQQQQQQHHYQQEHSQQNRMRVRSAAIASVSSIFFTFTTPTTYSSCHAFSTMTTTTAAAASSKSPLATLELDNSWPRELSPETEENLKKSRVIENLSSDDQNRTKRPVFNGHYVPVQPTGLNDPELILVSNDVASHLLKLTKEQTESDDFVQWVSGNLQLQESWATPYALSIMGTRYKSNCPYGTGNGYGDGRAISIAEFNGYELQLKGAGKTPFARGADGRAVLRSSIREFLASEAMHYLGVETTRALSLVRSKKDFIHRPWYSPNSVLQIPDMDDVRLANYPEDQRKQIIARLRNTQKADPNIMIQESCAITCRVAPSFVRIGHLDLFALRASRASQETYDDTKLKFNRNTNEWKELEALVWHACKREFKNEAYDPFVESKDIAGAATRLLELSAPKIATMVTNWVRVGFAQGNFNADNCLVGGRTMDYGPFGWMEEYTPLFAKWTGSGQHFGFRNQPSAGFVNYQVLVESVVPVICAARGNENSDELIDDFMTKAQTIFNQKVDGIRRIKLGLPEDADAADDLCDSLEDLMQTTRTDWTIFWRQLTYIMKEYPDLYDNSEEFEEMMTILEGEGDSGSFYETLTPEVRRQWIAWIKDWRELLKASKLDGKEVYESMRTTNPKFVLREWMLVDAYTSADDEDYTILNELHDLIQRPYDEGSATETKAYYRRAPESASARGGTAFMS